MSLLIISGSVGVGKTSVAEAVSDILTGKFIPHAVIDLDCLRHAYPRPKNDPFHFHLGMKNLAAVWKNYKEVGIACLIIPHVFESRSELDDFHAVIPDATIQVIGLRAKLETIHNRLKTRKKDSSLKWHLDRATVLNKQFEQNQVKDNVIDTDNMSINAVAEEIIARSGFLRK